jgi:hypothetical protein
MAYTGAVPTYTSFPVDYFSGDGVTTAFNLTYPASAEGSVLVTVNNQHVYTNKYTVNNKSLVFSNYVPPIGTNNIEVIYLGVPSISEGVTGVTSVGIASDLSGVTVTNSPVITAGVIRLGGTLNVANGGTGNTTLPQYNILLGNGSGAISNVNTLGASNQVLTSNGTGAAPGWTNIVNSFSAGATGLTPSGTSTGAITLGGTLNITSGGTGVTTVPLNRVVLGNGNNPLTTVANTGNINQVLTSQGTNNAPIWVDLPVKSVTATSGLGLTLVNTTGNIVLAGILAVTNGGTGATVFSPNTLTVANSTGNTLISLANGSNGQVLGINASGALTWLTLSTGGLVSITGVPGLGLTFSNTGGAVTVGGTLSVTNGGTNTTSFIANRVIASANDGLSLLPLPAGSTGQILTSTGTGAPTWQAPVYQNTWTSPTTVPIGGIVLAQLSISNSAYNYQVPPALGNIQTITGSSTPYLVVNSGGAIVSLDAGTYRFIGSFTGTGNGLWVRIS